MIQFSIVIPLYNKEQYIKRAIDSILNQNIQNYEILVVDDGSTDRSYQVVQEMQNEKVRIIKKRNGGESSARNAGIENAKYEYIAFLDADDEWEHNYLKEISRLIKLFPNAGIYGTGYVFMFSDNNIKEPKFTNINTNSSEIFENYFKCVLKDPIITSSNSVVPKKIFYEVGMFNTTLTHGGDLEMWMRIAFKYKIAFSKKICSIYHKEAENRVCNIFPNLNSTIIYLIEKQYNCMKLNDEVHRYFDRIRMYFATEYIINGDGATGRNILSKHRNNLEYYKWWILSWLSPESIRILIHLNNLKYWHNNINAS